MKSIWKWILGILIVLALLAIPIAFHYTLGNTFTRGFDMRLQMMDEGGWNHPGLRDMHRGWDNPRGFDRGFGMHGFGFFGPFVLLGGLGKLFFFAALLYGAYWLGRRNARLALDPVPVAPPSTSVPDDESAPVRKSRRKDTKTE